MDINEQFQFFSESLGLINDRDKEKSCFRVFLELLKASNDNNILSSDEISEKANLSRATVIHHIDKLINSGLVISNKEGYFLRSNDLTNLLDEIKDEVNKSIENLRETARDINQAKERLSNKESYIL